MKKSAFNELLESVQQMDTIVNGRQQSRKMLLAAPSKLDKYMNNKVDRKTKHPTANDD